MSGEFNFAQLNDVERRYNELSSRLSDPKVIGRAEEFQKLSKEHASLTDIVEAFRRYKKTVQEIDEGSEIAKSNDADIAAMAKQELTVLEERKAKITEELRFLLIPKDPNDEKNVFLEIRAGTGGEEAALFAAELMRLYLRFAERRRWKVEMMSKSETGLGGLKEAIILLEGKNVYSQLKYEGGVHRVQRVPATEGSGRIHTSAVTVAVLPEAEEIDLKIDEKELQFDVMRASGPGGQSVNTTDSAVRVTHIPTGLVVVCQDEKSQHKNKAKALRVLRARLMEREEAKRQAEIASARRSMVGTGDRSERIRTYNFPQNRLTDHRIGLTLYRLDSIMEGDLDEIVAALRLYFQAENLKNAGSQLTASSRN
ncbi:MAG TPA: peptide chain release factor 1 [Bdellovibrionota bacterium]|nr:peptide chain release factor 1 [Bdellovibrionota bacterium]